MRRPGYTPVGLPPDDLQGEHNGPPDSENGGHGSGLPPIPVGPAGGQVPWQHMQPQQPPMQLPRSSNTLLIHLYHLHNLPVVLAVV
jgi:hypothetical protein